jgi:tetratricopeptide (TPR) repeat protein
MRGLRLLIALAILSAPVAAVADPTAKELYESGLRHYNVSEYDLALVDFKNAYQKSGRSELLYNIAQCYRAMNDPAHAYAQYRAFLRENPDAPNRAEVEKRIVEMEAAAKAQKQPPSEPPPTPAPPPAEATTPAPAATTTPAPVVTTTAAAATTTTTSAAERPRHGKAWVWGVVAGAVVLVAAGVTVGVVLGTRDSTRTLSDFRPMP